MAGLSISKHGISRCQQRGIQPKALELVRMFGTQIEDRTAEIYFLKNKDVDDAIRMMKDTIRIMEKIKGIAVVISEDTLITAYHAHGSGQRRLLRR
jgi:hypothetical protein